MYYYEGINANDGKIVYEEDAFGVAMDGILKNEEDFDEFEETFGKTMALGMVSCRSQFVSFAKDVVDWYFSGDWIHRKG